MAKSVDEIMAYASELSLSDRAELTMRLVQDIEGDSLESPETVEALWRIEIERRLALLDSGEAELVTAEEAFRQIRKRLHP